MWFPVKNPGTSFDSISKLCYLILLNLDFHFAFLTIDFTTFGALRLLAVSEIELRATFADPAVYASWIAISQGVIGYVAGDYRASADEGIPADAIATDDGGIGANGGSFLHQGS